MKTKDDFLKQIEVQANKGMEPIKELAVGLIEKDMRSKTAIPVFLTQFMIQSHMLKVLTEVMIDIRDEMVTTNNTLTNIKADLRYTK